RLTKDYLWKTFTSLLKRFEYDSLKPSSPPIVYSLPLAFPIRQVTRLPIRIPSDNF
ncbi:7848_t:CDS:1, partial [Rhizophagus irregularis]